MKQYVVDAFSDRVFGGNPAAVYIMESWLPDEVLMNITTLKQPVRNGICGVGK